jgi:sugar transferase (PEP-CTERM/EpsH1 system associated)
VSTSLKIKILHVISSFNIGGLENGIVNLINGSDTNIFTHHICCIKSTGRASGRLNKKIRIFEMQKKEGNDITIIFKIVKLIKMLRPDIVHTRNWGSIDGIYSARIAGTPVIIHGEHGWNIDDPIGKNYRRRMARRIISPMVTSFIVVSEDMKNWLINSIGIKRSKVKKIINGVDTAKFRPVTENALDLNFKLKRGEITIGTVGRLDPIKNHDLLIKAFDKINSKYKMKLVIVGKGPERKHLENLKNKLSCRDRIVFMGERSNINEILRNWDIFVLPSKNEGMSNTILEAMATGLPIIASKVGGNPELVSDGMTGLLISNGNIEDLRRAVVYYLDHPDKIKTHGERARIKTESRFSLKKMVEEYRNLYTSLCISKYQKSNSH